METKTVTEKLEALSKLQKIDSKIDEIKKMRGDLPEEVNDLEDEIIGQETRINKFGEKIDGLKNGISESKQAIKDAKALIKKYEEQQMNVRNNREYDAITKEIELQELELKISDKKIKEYEAEIELKNEELAELKGSLDDRKKDLKVKKKELDVIIKESEEEEKKLEKSRVKSEKEIEERLALAYNRIRNNAKNGLAVVSVARNACGGCFNTVPPQRQADIAQKKKLIVCEHCGRIFADVEIVIEPVKKRATRRKKKEV